MRANVPFAFPCAPCDPGRPEPESQNPNLRTRISGPESRARHPETLLRCVAMGCRKAGSARVRFMAPRRVQGRSAPPTPSQESATGQTVLPVARTSRPGLLGNAGATSRQMTPVEWIPHQFLIGQVLCGGIDLVFGHRSIAARGPHFTRRTPQLSTREVVSLKGGPYQPRSTLTSGCSAAQPGPASA